ncbi:PQQ-binding-like beta-propeller repeat protein [Planctomycetes bacterium K23_9]|uniref:PQQ enzyme repeat protein n=1 Tax=Stieleria marina TaxID=1930275 RepID=A0A517NZ61_9BACT|nr:PQQ enzyme repeat protein [Planctomycetes bacterium K23_9]
MNQNCWPSLYFFNRSRITPLFVCFCVAVLLVASATKQASGQAGIMRQTRGMSSARFIEAPRYIQQELREAERAIAEDRMSDAVVRLGDLLQREPLDSVDSDLSGQDFFLPPDRGTKFSDSKLNRARRLIGELPASAIDIYELRYGPLARKTLQEAGPERDWNAVGDVRRKYFHTLAGYEASLILAQHELFNGHPLAASLLLDDVVVSPRAVNHLGQSVKLIHAAAMQLAGRDLKDVELPSSGTVRVGQVQTEWPKADAVNDWIEAKFSQRQRQAGGTLKSYPMFGGKPNRNEASDGQMPLANARWQVETTSTPGEARTIEKVASELIASGQLPPPSLMPIRVGEHLLMRTTNRLFGVNYKTGKRIWNYPWYSIDESTEDDQAPPTVMGQVKGDSLLAQRVWNDLPYGQLTSDSERVFFIDDLNEVEIVAFSPMGMRGTRPANTGTNTLVALDLRTEGSLLWRLGEGADDASSLFDAFFLGPPLPLNGRLYVMAEVAGDVLLVCLDPATGDEIWRQQLVAVETGAIDVDAARRVTGATPTYSEGLLICPTGAGATVAVDLVDRTLRWGVTYARRSTPREVLGSRSGRMNPSQLLQRWHNGAAVAMDNSLVLTPAESDTLMCLDLLTGTRHFGDRKREDLRYLAGVRDAKIILVGARRMLAVDLETGAEVWRTEKDLLAIGQQIVGRGVFGEDDYLLPASSNELVRVSLKDGKVLARRSTKFALGNLVAVDGEIISQSSTSLAVAYGEQTLEPLVNARLAENPNDFEALVRKAELLIQRNRRTDALELLDRARSIDSESVEVHMLSVSAMLGLLREGKPGSDALADQLDTMIDRPSERVEFLSLQIQASLKNDEPESAAKRLIQLSQLLGGTEQLDNAGKEVINDSARECDLNNWVVARMAEVKQIADEKQIEAINEQVRKFVERKLEGAKSSLISVINHFAPFDVSAALSTLGAKLLDEESYLTLERLVIGPNSNDGTLFDSLTAKDLVLLTQAYVRGGMVKDAVKLIDKIHKREFEDSLPEVLSEMELLAEQKSAQPTWDDKVALDWQSSPTPQQGLGMIQTERRLMSTEVISNETFRGWKLIAEGGRTLAMRDRVGRVIGMPTGGAVRREVGEREAKINGGMMVVHRGGELTAVDLYKILGNQGIESVLWKRKFGGDSSTAITRTSVSSKFGPSFVRRLITASRASAVPGEFRVGTMLGDRVFVLQGGDLMAIDLMTSKTLWRNSTAPPQGAVVSDGKRVAVVCEPLDKVVFFDALDGRHLGEQKWEHGIVWADTGENVLCFSETDDRWKYNLRVVNPFSKQVLLDTVSYSSNRAGEGEKRAFGKIVSQRYLLLLNTQGKLKVWDILKGKEIVDAEIGEYADLKAIHGVELDGQLVVFPERLDSMVTAADGEESQTEQGLFHKTADALFAYSLNDGGLRWKKEFDSPWGCTLSQPGDSPILLLTRLRWKIDDTRARKSKMDAIAVDVRNGKTIHQRLGTPVPSRMNEQHAKITVQSVQDRVVAQIGNEILTYKFGETDAENDGKGEAGKPKEAKDPSELPLLDDLFGE